MKIIKAVIPIVMILGLAQAGIFSEIVDYAKDKAS